MKSVVITGVSTGIGKGAAEELLESGYRVFGSVRREADAADLRQRYGDTFVPLVFDVTDKQAIAKAAEQVREALGGETLAGLVNNAGIAAPGPLAHIDLEDVRHQLDVNVLGLLAVTQAFVPLLGADKTLTGAPGRIVNISSVAGKMASPFLGPYAASKFAVEGLSESLRRELMLHGIDVIIVGPGAVKTPIWDKAEDIDASIYAGTGYEDALNRVKDYMLKTGRKGLSPRKLGRAVKTALTAEKPKTRYAVVPGRLMNWTIPRLLPKRFTDRMIARRLGLLSKN